MALHSRKRFISTLQAVFQHEPEEEHMFRARSVPRGMSPQRSIVAEYIRSGSRPSSPATSRTASVIPVSLDALCLMHSLCLWAQLHCSCAQASHLRQPATSRMACELSCAICNPQPGLRQSADYIC